MRKEKLIAIPASPAGEEENRDAGKVFHIKEMPAEQGEKWAYRTLLAIGAADLNLSDVELQEFALGGWQSLAIVGIRAITRMNWEHAEPLLDEMMTCVQIVPDPKNPMLRRPLWEEDIEEITTLVHLRQEFVQLHMGFLKTVFRSMRQSKTVPQN